MYKHFITFCAVAAAFVLAGCQKEQNIEIEEVGPTHSLVFSAERGDLSKTAIASEDGVVSYKWIDGDIDRMNIYENGTKGIITDMQMQNGGQTATFYVSFPGNAPEVDVVYTAKYAGSLSTKGNPLIPAIQEPTLTSFDPNADVMVSDPITLTARAENSSFRFMMHRKVSVNKMTLKGLTDVEEGEKIISVAISSDQHHSAYYVEASSDKQESYSPNGKRLTISYGSEGAEIPSDGLFPVYFTTAPVEGVVLTVRVTTNKAVYEKTLPSNRPITLSVGTVKMFNVNLSGLRTETTAGDTFKLIESTSKIPSLCDVIIVGENSGNYYAIGEQKNNNRAAVEVSDPVNNEISLESTSSVHVFALEKKSGGFAFKDKDTDKYLYAASKSSNHLKSKDLDSDCYWTIEINEGDALVVSTSEYTHNTMRFNYAQSSNLFFSCYLPTFNTSVNSVALYAANATVDTRIDPELSFEEDKVEFTINDSDYDAFEGQTLFKPQGIDDSEITWTTSDESKATVSNGEISLIEGKYGIVTVTASFEGNETFKPASASYTIVIGSTVGLAIENVGEHILLEATVYAAIGGDNEYEAFIVGDETAKLFCYKKGHGLAVGDVVRLEGSTSIYSQSGVYELSPETITKINHVDTVDHGTPLDYDSNAASLISIFSNKENRRADTHSAKYVHITGTQLKRIITTTGDNKVREYISETAVADLNATVDIYAYAYDLSVDTEIGLMNILLVSKTITGQLEPAGLSFEPETINYTIGQTFTAPTLNNPNDLTGITYSSDNLNVAVVDNNTGAVTLQGNAGTAIITATFAGDGEYAAGSASYTINVITPAQDGDVLWREDFTGYSSLPSSATGDHVYQSFTVNYTTVDGGSETKLYGENYAGGEKPELLIGKTTGSYTISDIPIAGATVMTLTFKSNNSNWDVSSPTSGILISRVNSQSIVFSISATGSITKFDLVISATSGNTRVDNFMLTVGAPVVPTLSSIAVSDQQTTFTVGDSFSFGGTVTATYSDGSTADVTSLATISNPDMSAAGTKTVTVSYSEGEVEKTVTYEITVNAASGNSVTYDFTGSDWTVSDGVLSNGTVSFTGNGANFKMNTGYFMLGKANAYINFPTYSSSVSKIVVTGRSGASGSVVQNIFVGSTAVSTATTGATGANTYNIDSNYQVAGTTYTLKVTSNHNTQITKIEVFFN